MAALQEYIGDWGLGPMEIDSPIGKKEIDESNINGQAAGQMPPIFEMRISTTGSLGLAVFTHG